MGNVVLQTQLQGELEPLRNTVHLVGCEREGVTGAEDGVTWRMGDNMEDNMEDGGQYGGQ